MWNFLFYMFICTTNPIYENDIRAPVVPLDSSTTKTYNQKLLPQLPSDLSTVMMLLGTCGVPSDFSILLFQTFGFVLCFSPRFYAFVMFVNWVFRYGNITMGTSLSCALQGEPIPGMCAPSKKRAGGVAPAACRPGRVLASRSDAWQTQADFVHGSPGR